jgi:ribonuclease HI
MDKEIFYVRDYGEDVRAEVTACRGLWLWSDGGLVNIGKSENPSPYGGPWAWRITHNGIPLDEASGLLLPGLSSGVTNNQTELEALVRGMIAIQARAKMGEPITIGIDSDVTLNRLWGTSPWSNVSESDRKNAFGAKSTWSAK